MRYLLLLLFAFPIASAGQPTSCGAAGFTAFGSMISYPKAYGTAVGFHASRHQPLNDGNLYLGIGLDAIRLQESSSWYLPLSIHLTVMTSRKQITPVFVFSPGYGLYNGRTTKNGESVSASGGLTLYGGAGMVVGNAMLIAGFQQFSIITPGKTNKATGPGFRIAVTLP